MTVSKSASLILYKSSIGTLLVKCSGTIQEARYVLRMDEKEFRRALGLANEAAAQNLKGQVTTTTARKDSARVFFVVEPVVAATPSANEPSA